MKPVNCTKFLAFSQLMKTKRVNPAQISRTVFASKVKAVVRKQTVIVKCTCSDCQPNHVASRMTPKQSQPDQSCMQRCMHNEQWSILSSKHTLTITIQEWKGVGANRLDKYFDRKQLFCPLVLHSHDTCDHPLSSLIYRGQWFQQKEI